MTARTYRLAPAATDAAGTVHEPRVCQEGGGYRVTCECGHQGPWRHVRRLTTGDRDAHLGQVSVVPEAERCQQPRAHRTYPWERCPLCRDQLDLFDLTERTSTDDKGARDG